MEQMKKPEVESIEGLSPSISIEQKNISRSPRSTVGTVTEIYDYLRLLYARVGIPHCPDCGKEIRGQNIQQIIDQISEWEEGTKFSVLAPIARGKKGEFQKELMTFRSKGFVRARIDGQELSLAQPIQLKKSHRHDISIYVDRLILRKGLEGRLAEALEMAIDITKGLVEVELPGKVPLLFSTQFACVDCGQSFAELEPRNFSFNSSYGACPQCDGLGAIYTENPDASDKEEETPLHAEICSLCLGSRLKKESLSVKFNGFNIAEFCEQTIKQCLATVEAVKLNKNQTVVATPLLKEVRARLNFLLNVGLDYLTLSRSAHTLSGGEAQRIRLATQIGSHLIGVLYVLDEPSIGLHQRDNERLIQTLENLRDQGNTVIVVEHDQDTIERADFIVDMGPGAGSRGGYITFAGSPKDLKTAKNSLTSLYLRGEMTVPVPKARRPSKKKIEVKGCSLHNLKEIDLTIPLGNFIVVTGVSGSGKSTLVIDTLLPLLRGEDPKKLLCTSISGREHIDKVIHVDQGPIGRTPRSNPATYTGLFSDIRTLFAALPDSQIRGYTASRFSFNVEGGRCEACSGDGTLRISMHFLPDVFVPCEICRGKRYNRETLDILYRGKSIADVLAMTTEEALSFFDRIPSLKNKLLLFVEVGLGYIQLGQNAVTLSGGEAQRIKLTKELSKRATGKTLYILDEPTTGLHFEDIRKLVEILHLLVDQGNTVIVIEHHLDVIKQGDTLIDLGPEGGDKGGMIVGTGTPEELAKNGRSYTGHYLKKLLFVGDTPTKKNPEGTSPKDLV